MKSANPLSRPRLPLESRIDRRRTVPSAELGEFGESPKKFSILTELELGGSPRKFALRSVSDSYADHRSIRGSLLQRGAAAVLRVACSIRRSTLVVLSRRA